MNKKGASQDSLNNVDAEISELIDNDLKKDIHQMLENTILDEQL